MKKILILLIFILSNCGYQPIYLNNSTNSLIFKKIELIGDKNINRYIVSGLSIKESFNNYSFEKLILENSKTIIESAKNSKGQVESYKMIINIKMKIKNKENYFLDKTFNEEFSYRNLDNKFNLSQYEINLQNNLLNKIVEEAIIYLNL